MGKSITKINKKANNKINNETIGLFYGFLGVIGFSGTLPATRIAVTDFEPIFVGLGRAIIAAAFGMVLLRLTRQPIPHRQYWGSLAIIVAGVIIGFPLLSAWAMQQLPASHGAIVTGILPLATAIVAALRMGEKPSLGFWIASFFGSLTIVSFALIEGNGSIKFADIVLIIAVIAAAFGYAEGGKLAKILGGWQVICWALVFSAPLLIIPVASVALKNGITASPSAWLGFGYVSAISMFLSFFAWYRGLAIGGIARVSQVQLLQPFLSILFSAFFLREKITYLMMFTAIIVVITVAIGRKQPVERI
ncbi:DMT(drug/metabolite transporter) superfamily permease [Rivularia sp. PCC 7116]|uniref:DMT family transporter n=1 Tax=Rivularia sp. PCC 7116 TaxID=373994 RepID=UPI00029ED2A2|nr:DMT family transporter [Rivularia sp. PCC 7116]AFY58201.1 DMT(drug/metabolite transporter) superfamily permease [Rivularia sp. PCC 7116]